MNDTHDEVVSRLKRLGALTPTPEATSLALDRVRSALAASPVPDPPSRWRLVRNRWAGIAAMALSLLGCLPGCCFQRHRVGRGPMCKPP